MGSLAFGSWRASFVDHGGILSQHIGLNEKKLNLSLRLATKLMRSHPILSHAFGFLLDESRVAPFRRRARSSVDTPPFTDKLSRSVTRACSPRKFRAPTRRRFEHVNLNRIIA